jgi:hypothetical protein
MPKRAVQINVRFGRQIEVQRGLDLFGDNLRDEHDR